MELPLATRAPGRDQRMSTPTIQREVKEARCVGFIEPRSLHGAMPAPEVKFWGELPGRSEQKCVAQRRRPMIPFRGPQTRLTGPILDLLKSGGLLHSLESPAGHGSTKTISNLCQSSHL